MKQIFPLGEDEPDYGSVEENHVNFNESLAVVTSATPCTREDVADVVSKVVSPLHTDIQRIQVVIERLAISQDLKSVFKCVSPNFDTASTQITSNVKSSLSTSKDACAEPQEGTKSSQIASARPSRDSENVSPKTSRSRRSSFTKHDSSLGVRVLASEDRSSARSLAGRAVSSMQAMEELAILGPRKNRYNRSLVRLLQGYADWWENLKEPPRSGVLGVFVQSHAFEAVCSFTIIANSVLVAYASDTEMQDPSASQNKTLVIAETVFAIFYMVELMMRLFVNRLYFFVNDEMKWNWLDFVLVILSLVDMFSAWMMAATDNKNVNSVRILRLCKLAKIFRAFRLTRFFKALRIMLDSFNRCLAPLFWSMVMICFMLYVFAVLFLQGAASFLHEGGDHINESLKRDIKSSFGSMSLTIFSLYAAVTGGKDWMDDYVLLESAGHLYAALYLFFIFFFTLAVFNILTGTFVEQALLAAAPNRDDLVLQHKRKASDDAKEFRHLCSVLDSQKKGTINWEEFSKHMENEIMVAYMASIGLELHEVELFFDIVAGATTCEHDEVPIERFVEGCMMMKGLATGVDMQRNLYETSMLRGDISRLERVIFDALEWRQSLLGVGQYGDSECPAQEIIDTRSL